MHSLVHSPRYPWGQQSAVKASSWGLSPTKYQIQVGNIRKLRPCKVSSVLGACTITVTGVQPTCLTFSLTLTARLFIIAENCAAVLVRLSSILAESKNMACYSDILHTI